MSSRLIYTYIIGLLALFLLFFLATPYYSKLIPETLEKNARQQLNSIDANWSNVKASNRDLILTGKAPTPEAHQAALNALKQVSAVRNIHDHTTQNIIKPYTMSLEWENKTLHVKGFVPDEKSLQEVTDLLGDTYPDQDISHQFKVAQGHPEKWTELTSTILSNVPVLDRANIDLINQNLDLAAQTEKTTSKEQFLEALEPFQHAGYKINSHIVAQDVAIMRCQRRFDELLNSGKISFASGKAVIRKSSYTLLTQLAQTAQVCPSSQLNIAGHTDSKGSAEKNLSLSQERAEAVAQWLVQAGVNQQRIKTIGYGSKQPIADNETEAGRAKNRRIEFTVRGN